MTKGMKYEMDRHEQPLQCQKSPQELGFDLDPCKDVVERNQKKKDHTCPSRKTQIPAPVPTRLIAVCSAVP